MGGVCGGAGGRKGRGTYSNVFFRVHCLLNFFLGGGKPSARYFLEGEGGRGGGFGG